MLRYWEKMRRKKLLGIILAGLFLLPALAAQNYIKTDAYLFSFPEGKDLLLADYGDNAFALQEMNKKLQQMRVPLLSNRYHLLIVAHTCAHHYWQADIINQSSLRAVRLQRYLKSKLNIPQECMAFYIDRSGLYRDQVHVYLVHGPLPWYVNQEICYSESRYPKAVQKALKGYGSIPYVDLFQRGRMEGYDLQIYVIFDELFRREELEDYRLAVILDPAASTTAVTAKKKVKNDENKQRVGSASRANERNGGTAPDNDRLSQQKGRRVRGGSPNPNRNHRIAGAVARTSAGHSHVSPFQLAVKTNLLPWCTVVPSVMLGAGEEKIMTGTFMPNLELEYYFGDRWSVAISGMYADFAYKNKERDHWALSQLGFSPRIWPLGKGEFRWLNTGFFFAYGDFDMRGALISSDPDNLYGRTGRFWSAGASVGTLVPLGAGFCVEAEIQMGYRSVFNGEKYRYEPLDRKNYLETEFSRTGFLLGAKINLVYRFGFR